MKLTTRLSVWAFAIVTLSAGAVATARPASAAAPANNNFANAEVLANSGSIVRSNVGADGQANEPAPVTGDAVATIWFRWVSTSNHRAIVDTIGSDIDTVLAVYDVPSGPVSLGTLNEVASDDDGFGCDTQSLVQFDAIAGRTYWIQIDSWDPADKSPNLHLQWNNVRGDPPANDDIADASVVAPSPGLTINGITDEATAEIDQFEDETATNTVWYRFPVLTNDVASFSIVSSSSDNVFDYAPYHALTVFTGSAADQLTYEDATSTGDSPVSANLVAGQTVWLQVISYPCEQGGFTVTMTSESDAVTTQYDQIEYDLLVTAAVSVGLTPEQLQHDSVGIIEFIYGIAGVTGPIAIDPPAGGTVSLASQWPAAERPVLNALTSKWVGLTDAESQKYATGIVIFLLSLS